MPAGRRHALALAALLCAAACTRPEVIDLADARAQVRIRSVERSVLLDRLAAAPRDDAERGLLIEHFFRKAGCREELERRPIASAKLPNLVCTLRGRSPARIVVGANYDRPKGGRGIVDDWSGAALLPSLFAALLGERRHHTFEFVAFYDSVGWREPMARKTWNRGAEHWVRELDDGERTRLRGMVGLLAIGLGPLAAWADHADPELWHDFATVARALGHPLIDVGFEGGMPSDAEPFRMWGLPSITLHSHDDESVAILRDATRDRSLARIDPDHYAASFRLIAAYLAYLDQTLAMRATAPAAAPPTP